MKYTQAGWLVALWLLAIPGYSFQLRVEQPLPPNTESAGQQFIDVILERESGDGTAACQVDGNVDAIDNPSPGLQDAIDGLDYVGQNFTFSLTLPDSVGLVSARFPVTVLDDVIFEGDESFTAIISNFLPVGCATAVSSGQPASIQITDDDVAAVDLSFVQTVTEVDETAGTLTVGVTLVGAATVDDTFSVQVNFNTADGTATAGLDYVSPGLGTLGFNATTLTQFITLVILDDALIEGSENFQIALSGAAGFIDDGVPFAPNILTPTMTVTITDDENPPGNIVFASPPLTAAEGAGVTTITLSRVNGNSGIVQIDVASANGTATAGLDYTAIATTLTWSDGDTADQTFSIGILDDGLVEGDETLTLALTNPNNPSAPPATETLTIFDDDTNAGVQFTAAAVTTTEDVGTVTLTVTRAGNSTGAITVDFVTADGTATQANDYTTAAGTLTWADGDVTDQTISVDITDDTTDEADEDFTVSLFNLTGQATLGANNPVTVTISSNDTTRSVSSISTLTPNQRSLATFFDTVCPGLDQADGGTTSGQQDLDGVCKLIRGVGTTDGQVASAFDAINPDELFAAPINALKLTAIQHVNLSQRFSALRGGATGIDLAGLNLEINGVQIPASELAEFVNKLFGGGASADEPWGKWGLFIDGKISTGEKDASLFESGFDFDLYGFTVGLDYRIKQNFIVGVAAGFGSVDTDYHGSRGGLDIESWNGSAFLTYFTENTYYFDALATYGRNDYDSSREILFSTMNGVTQRTARGDSEGDQLSAGFGTGWDFSKKAFTYGPHLGAYYINVVVDAFDETGSGGLELAIGEQRTESLTANFGGHVSYAISMNWGVLVPNARVDWVHEFMANREALSYRFIHDPFIADPNNPTPPIKIKTDKPDPDYLLWSVGVSAQFIYGVSGFVNYQTFTGYKNVTIHEVSLGLRWEKTW